MGVVFKGGTSGCREDFSPPVPTSGVSQPLIDTAKSGNGSNVQWCQNSGNREEASPDVPTGVDLHPTDLRDGGVGPDSAQPDIVGTPSNPFTSGEGTIFRGAPNVGLKGGPA